MSDDDEFENIFFNEVEHFSGEQSYFGNQTFSVESSPLNFIPNNQQFCNCSTHEYEQHGFQGQSSTSLSNQSSFCELSEIEYDWRYPGEMSGFTSDSVTCPGGSSPDFSEPVNPNFHGNGKHLSSSYYGNQSENKTTRLRRLVFTLRIDVPEHFDVYPEVNWKVVPRQKSNQSPSYYTKFKAKSSTNDASNTEKLEKDFGKTSKTFLKNLWSSLGKNENDQNLTSESSINSQQVPEKEMESSMFDKPAPISQNYDKNSFLDNAFEPCNQITNNSQDGFGVTETMSEKELLSEGTQFINTLMENSGGSFISYTPGKDTHFYPGSEVKGQLGQSSESQSVSGNHAFSEGRNSQYFEQVANQPWPAPMSDQNLQSNNSMFDDQQWWDNGGYHDNKNSGVPTSIDPASSNNTMNPLPTSIENTTEGKPQQIKQKSSKHTKRINGGHGRLDDLDDWDSDDSGDYYGCYDNGSDYDSDDDDGYDQFGYHPLYNSSAKLKPVGDSSLAALLESLADYEGFEVHDVDADGNCMFAAVLDQLHISGQLNHSVKSLRKSAVSYLRENPVQKDGTHLALFLQTETWDEYLSRMSRDSVWGDHMMLNALTEFLGYRVVVMTTNPESQTKTVIEPASFDISRGLFTLYLGHIGDCHFNSLRPKTWEEDWPAKAKIYQEKTNLIHWIESACAVPCNDGQQKLLNGGTGSVKDDALWETGAEIKKEMGDKSESEVMEEKEMKKDLTKVRVNSINRETDVKENENKQQQQQQQSKMENEKLGDRDLTRQKDESSNSEDLMQRESTETQDVSSDKIRTNEGKDDRIETNQKPKTGNEEIGEQSGNDTKKVQDETEEQSGNDTTSQKKDEVLNKLYDLIYQICEENEIEDEYENLKLTKTDDDLSGHGTLFDDRLQIDPVSGVALPHLRFILRNILRESQEIFCRPCYASKTIPDQLRKYIECIGSTVEGLDYYLFNRSKFMAGKTQPKKLQVLFSFVQSKVHTSASNQQIDQDDVLSVTQDIHPGYLNLKPVNKERCKKYVNEEVDENFIICPTLPTPISAELKNKKGFIIMYKLFCPEWPESTSEWVCRDRPSNWPDPHLMEQIMNYGCYVVSKPHPQSAKPEIEWMYMFTRAEKTLVSEALTVDMKYCFSLFKVFVDYQTKGIQPKLSTNLLKTVLFYACEVVPPSCWINNVGSCFLYLLQQLLRCLKDRNIPNYFIRDNNMIDHFPEDSIGKFIRKIEILRTFPVLSLKFLAEHHSLTSKLWMLKKVVFDMEKFRNDRNLEGTVYRCFVKVATEQSKKYVNFEKYDKAYGSMEQIYQEEILSTHTSPPSFQEFFESVLSQEKDEVFLFWLGFQAEIMLGKTLLPKLLQKVNTVPIGQVADGVSPGKYDAVPVPKSLLTQGQFGEISFLDKFTTQLYHCKDYKEGDRYIICNISKIKSARQTTVDISEVTEAQIRYQVTNKTKSLDRLLFYNMYDLLKNFYWERNMEKIREYINEFEECCKKLNTTEAYSKLSNVWDWLESEENPTANSRHSSYRHTSTYTSSWPSSSSQTWSTKGDNSTSSTADNGSFSNLNQSPSGSFREEMLNYILSGLSEYNTPDEDILD